MVARKRRRKKATTKKAPATKAKRIKKVVDHTKDPVFQLKPNDLIEYQYYIDGELSKPEIHLVVEPYYDRDPKAVSSQFTLELRDDKLCSNTLYCWGPNACKITHLNATHKLELVVENGESTWKLTKKRGRKAK